MGNPQTEAHSFCGFLFFRSLAVEYYPYIDYNELEWRCVYDERYENSYNCRPVRRHRRPGSYFEKTAGYPDGSGAQPP